MKPYLNPSGNCRRSRCCYDTDVQIAGHSIAVACSGLERRIGGKSCGTETPQQKTAAIDGKDSEKAGSLPDSVTERVVVDNNHLSVDQNRSRSEELVNCQGDSSCRATVRDKYRQEYDRVQERIATCSGADQCVAVAKELRALQSNYSARMSEIQEKARMQGLDSLTPAEVREWADLRGAMSNIDASRNLALHRAQVTGGSEETTQEIVKIMGQTGIAASAGVAGGISKAGAKGVKGSAIPVPNPVTANNGLVYKSNHKHTPGGDRNRRNAGIKPKDSLKLFENSIPSSKNYGNKEVRFAKDEKGNIHRFEGTNGEYHWNGSSGDIKNQLTSKQVPSDIQKKLGVRLK
ncbi:hemolysin/hemagglutinin-like protein HecA precursor [Photorhabdus antumapuensis]|uniref:hemolysin/hemagglutinin-like protein HecA precursor n=1 Tax=Photorhabdus antumapuensis TaxID=2862867 RepID=UPI001CEE0550|nr:hemolysin/hemagglutinin-like protein HecA precursor [Photorhabdus antumapuensis]